MEFSVIVDSRERNIEVMDSLASLNINISVKTLPVGDYVISDRVCIERKTVSDFESSLMNGRLFDQLKRAKEYYESPILVIEGSSEEFRLANNVIIGTIASLYIDMNIQLVFSTGPKNTAEIIAAFAKHEQYKNKREPSLKGGIKAYTNAQYQEYVIGGLPGVGPKIAKALLSHFGSIKNIANAQIEELTSVDKIGKKKAQKIHDTLNLQYQK